MTIVNLMIPSVGSVESWEYSLVCNIRDQIGDGLAITPFIFLDTQRIQAMGWKPKLSIRDGVIKTVQYLYDNEWVFKARVNNAGLRAGLWHLGSVTAACLASVGHDVCWVWMRMSKPSKKSELGKAPLFEPGLDDLLQAGIDQGKLKFLVNAAQALEGVDVLWVAFDTPVDDEDRADVAYVQRQVQTVLPYLPDGAVVLVSSQMPVGSVQQVGDFCPEVDAAKKLEFACSPENLRLGKAIEVFTKPDRAVVGVVVTLHERYCKDCLNR